MAISHNPNRMPTGIPEFDMVIGGGLPRGSVVLLLGGVGAGQQEFAYTSAMKLCYHLEHPDEYETILHRTVDFQHLPNRVTYITSTRAKEDVVAEIRAAFDPAYYQAVSHRLDFEDLSADYFRNSIVPRSWIGESTSPFAAFGRSKGDILNSLIELIERHAPGNLVILDSLTDLALNENIPPHQLVSLLRGMQRAMKGWKGVVMLLLTEGVLPEQEQERIIDSVDGVLRFAWSSGQRTHRRMRYMWVEKFITLLTHLEDKDIVRFTTGVNIEGFMVMHQERI